jgi:hypothetical protein
VSDARLLREEAERDPQFRPQEVAVQALIRAGQEGAVSWAQVYEAIRAVEVGDEAEAGAEGAEREVVAMSDTKALSEEERVAAEGRAEADYAMAMEIAQAHERHAEMEMEREVER